MLNRIKWSEITGKKKDKDGNYYSLFLKLRIRFLIKNLNKANPNEEKEKNSCSLVWEGMIKNRAYGPIIFKMCPTATFAREYFKKVLIISIKIIKTEQIFIKINNKKN